jgi:two-component system, OmpR family, sensor histidine kinase VicK
VLEFVQGDSSTVTLAVNRKNMIKPLYYVKADPERIREVVTNLFDNAVKYTQTGFVRIGLTGNDKMVQIFVADSGMGMPSEDLPHLFQKFYRIDNSETRTIGGTGLGLFICKQILDLYNGQIWADSVAGKGSTFYINLPRHKDR